MQLFLLTTVTMMAFASNSLLTRLAVDGGHMDPNSFAIVRVLAGAVTLALILKARGGQIEIGQGRRVIGAISLAIYMAGFSLAYLTLDAGLGALILFGVVQISMFGHAAATKMQPSARQIFGASIAFVGLLLALWPGPGGQSDILGAGFMTLAGLGWAAYTVSGRAEADPLAATTGNFILCLPIVVVLLLAFATQTSVTGWALAVLCGGVTSGLGYAMWYTVLPRLPQNVAPVVQLSVPIIALVAGALLLGEEISLLVAGAAALVICGIALAITTGARSKRTP
ncbi:DMT family transporter [Roseobacter sinensis]|uniref:DMT family transporter n=1 Tax=Roseobacter sinensis TaxID=2931391 RepID=A0ABT3BAJ5_9RHOB|nr:DMT family transporter [Roseobacter sp. WL0113]MCV3270598.1 DMT family transporter [Roseobacter sp. WL0113]